MKGMPVRQQNGGLKIKTSATHMTFAPANPAGNPAVDDAKRPEARNMQKPMPLHLTGDDQLIRLVSREAPHKISQAPENTEPPDVIADDG